MSGGQLVQPMQSQSPALYGGCIAGTQRGSVLTSQRSREKVALLLCEPRAAGPAEDSSRKPLV